MTTVRKSFDLLGTYILQPPTEIYVPDWPLLSPSQHIFTCRPYLMLFTEKLEIVSPVCVLMMVISSPKAIELTLSSIFLNVVQFTSLQNLKVCALVHCTLETSTWAKTAVGIINKNKIKKLGRKILILGIVVASSSIWFALRCNDLPHYNSNTKYA